MNEEKKLDELFILFDVYNHEEDQYSDNEHLRSEYERYKHKGFIETLLVGVTDDESIAERFEKSSRNSQYVYLEGISWTDEETKKTDRANAIETVETAEEESPEEEAPAEPSDGKNDDAEHDNAEFRRQDEALTEAMIKHGFTQEEITAAHICNDGILYINGFSKERAETLLKKMAYHGLVQRPEERQIN
jgi:hypothetical protein